ncbi:CDGSH iron-sulfur domain-containing protein [Actinomycetospora corticicola]|uniref:CDGSH-type Zn-finger protein n=1 Tax=Actinomycetospora corticicola TaxID=663602 RepID=A0A7Y9DRF2_9PSEU|nr:CDGSH iron-sulfur domain-containing protein [Actinomycetospora corticicola]NYD34121.1 CDGSH-type Zn-finger protein [Actinomycetospora corticicola]
MSHPEPQPRLPRVPRVTLTDGGPVLVEGPVELETPDGEIVRSERPVVAVCTCRRSKRFPFCDTSHRKKVRQSAARKDDDPASQDRMR